MTTANVALAIATALTIIALIILGIPAAAAILISWAGFLTAYAFLVVR
jgi:hypothetical protein